MTLHYLDSSALLKRVLDEAESAALRSWIDAELLDGAALITSDLGDVEVARAARRYNFSEHEEQSATTDVRFRGIDERVIERARVVSDATLRSLDAIHLATALVIGVDTLVTYDDRLGQAARNAGLDVLAPG